MRSRTVVNEEWDDADDQEGNNTDGESLTGRPLSFLVVIFLS
jgi:hypothetical protein